MRKDTSPNEFINPPCVLDKLDVVSEILSANRVGIFSDFDGTLTPIFDDPRNTVLSPANRDAIGELSTVVELVAIVSGRDLNTLRKMIGLASVTYVGNHGLEEWTPGGEGQASELQISGGLMNEIEKGVGGIEVAGITLENKGLSVAAHYRNSPDPTTARTELLPLLKSLAAARGLKIGEGKMVLEIGPRVGVDKGTVVNRMVRDFRLTGVIVLGDDLTDCDAFDALHSLVRKGTLKGAAIAVVDEETPEAVTRRADYCLSGMREVGEFLRWMAYELPRASMKL